MKKYRCPECLNSSTTSYCCECETTIPMSCAYDDENDFFTIRKSYNRRREKPSGNYEKMYYLERVNFDTAYAMSKFLLNEEEQERYKREHIIKRIIGFIIFIIFAVVIYNR